MGWKNVRDHYGIGHIVKIVDGAVHIGSQFIGDLLVISADGTVVKAYDRNHGDLADVQRAVRADPARFAGLLEADDQVGETVPVFTWEDGRILELRCEEPGWPNVTVDGRLMYENRHFTDRDEALAAARRNAAGNVEAVERSIADAEAEQDRRRALLARLKGEAADLAREDA